MAKKVETGGIVSPANLWGKPLPRAPNKPTATKEGKATRMLPDEEIDSDVDAELEEDEAELVDEDSVEDEDEVSTVEATGADEDDDEDDDEDEDEDDDEDEDEEDEDEEDEDEDEDAEDDEFDSEEGDDDDADVSDVADKHASSIDSAVDVDEVSVPAATAAGAPLKVMKKMSEKKSISDYVRDEIEDRKSASESLRGIDIVNALAKRRIKVSPAQVSQLLKKAGVSQKARGGRKVPVAVAAAGPKSRAALKTKTVETRQQAPKIRATTSTTTELPWMQLNAAKAFIAACNGSFNEASDTLAMFHKIDTVLHN